MTDNKEINQVVSENTVFKLTTKEFAISGNGETSADSPQRLIVPEDRPDFLAGLIRISNKVVPVFDLFDKGTSTSLENACIVITELNEQLIGFIAESSSGLLK